MTKRKTYEEIITDYASKLEIIQLFYKEHIAEHYDDTGKEFMQLMNNLYPELKQSAIEMFCERANVVGHLREELLK